ncbi:MAG: hypothetical protein ACI8TQ_000814 [Planctomycetota bacterium]
MDLNDIWQENKRFICGVVGGALLFVIGLFVIQSMFGDELSSARRSKSRLERQLSEARYDTTSRDLARRENENMVEAFSELGEIVSYAARSDFRVTEAGGRPVNQYHRTVAKVREDLLSKAGRANLYLDSDLGLPDLSPAGDDEIERYLEALDSIARSVQWAIDAGVDRIDDVRIRLDPSLNSRKGTNAVERTRVEFELAGTGASLTAFLRATQRPLENRTGTGSRPLSIHSVELLPARNRLDESNLALSINLVRLHASAELTEDSQS